MERWMHFAYYVVLKKRYDQTLSQLLRDVAQHHENDLVSPEMGTYLQERVRQYRWGNAHRAEKCLEFSRNTLLPSTVHFSFRCLGANLRQKKKPIKMVFPLEDSVVCEVVAAIKTAFCEETANLGIVCVASPSSALAVIGLLHTTVVII